MRYSRVAEMEGLFQNVLMMVMVDVPDRISRR
jgi:hypothetical protein